MKKTKFYIYCYLPEKHAPGPKQVSGYFEFVDGVPLGIHKPDNSDQWTITELSTGFKIADGRTRKEAIENAIQYLPLVKEKLYNGKVDEKLKKVRDDIKAAYAA